MHRLQAAVGDQHRILKALGGGGMSRVFLAEEVRLGRQVVIKLLPPETGAAVNVERFEREPEPELQPGVREVPTRLALLATETPS